MVSRNDHMQAGFLGLVWIPLSIPLRTQSQRTNLERVYLGTVVNGIYMVLVLQDSLYLLRQELAIHLLNCV